ncbi:MAG TPA: anthranilate synthase component I family protein [Verrucomicrobiae bacterium]|nr:anthranilate synthase component I family protein [Verrucomicrobiae bacterium]
MRPLIVEASSWARDGTFLTPEALVNSLGPAEGVVLLRSALSDARRARYSLVAAQPFLTFRSFGSRTLLRTGTAEAERYGNPWHILDELMVQFELLDEIDLPFPLGGCFGFWGYDLKNFVEPKLRRSAPNDLELPDSWVGFYSSLVVFDHSLARSWIVATGLDESGERTIHRAEQDTRFWQDRLESATAARVQPKPSSEIQTHVSQEAFLNMVRRAQDYIRLGHIYQVNLSHRLSSTWSESGWKFFERLSFVSPAPFAAYLHGGDFEICSTSPEMFLRMSGFQIETRPIKGTRPRHPDLTRDAQLACELQTSTKEVSELVMITDLLRNDLGRVCEFGSIRVPDLVRLERYAQVQHLVSTIEGRLRAGVTHFAAFSSCFPGGSVTGAPKIRAMEIIDELERVSRGPYTGALGYLGFNRESQLSIIIRSALCVRGTLYFNVGAGIVADSIAEAEYEETMAKASGFIQALDPAFQPAAPLRSNSSSTDG